MFSKLQELKKVELGFLGFLDLEIMDFGEVSREIDRGLHIRRNGECRIKIWGCLGW